jgi:molybdenum cofactor cytidylyltransferase
MGTSKLLLPWGEGTILESVLAAWRASRVDHTVAVVLATDDKLLALCRSAGVDVAETPTRPADMKASVRFGLEEVAKRYQPDAGDAWLVGPADIPGLKPAVIDRLLAAHRPGNLAIVVPVHGLRRGHPALLPWGLVDEVSHLPQDRGIDELFTRYPVLNVDVQAADIPHDLDSPDDYENQIRRHGP